MLLKFNSGKVGNRACILSNVWKLGIHLFEIPECIVFRVCYLRTNKHTYYFDISKKREPCYTQCGVLNDCKRVDKKITKV